MTDSIRLAGIDDAPALTRLLDDIGWFQHYFKEATTAEIQARVAQKLRLTLADDSHSIYVAEDASGQLNAYVAVHWLPYLFLPGPEGFISELFVREAARGQNLGSQLLEVVKKEARQRGCVRLSLLNMRSRESYQRNFYGKRGWDERPEAANFVLKL